MAMKKLYWEFHDLYVKAHPNLSKAQCNDEANEKWNSMKNDKKAVDMDVYNREVGTLKSKMIKRKATMFDFLLKKRSKKVPSASSVDLDINQNKSPAGSVPSPDDPSTSTNVPTINLTENQGESSQSESEEDTVIKDGRRETPTQNKLKLELADINACLVKLNEARNLGLGSDHCALLTKQISEMTSKKKTVYSRLRSAELTRRRSQKARDKRKRAIEKAKKDFPALAHQLKSRDMPGRPPLEEELPNLHRDILEIATIGAATSDKRREDLFRSVKTLGDCHQALKDLGYQISRSALYNRLLPRSATSAEAKRHVRTVPVRLVRPENNLRKKHPDRPFAAESYNSAFGIAEIIGPLSAITLSVDDKSSVHIGTTAAKEQRPMLMNMSARVRLPDHDFAVGSRHLLVPSVVGINRINERGQVGYSGETYVAVRSQKHNNSSAYTHHQDLLKVVELFPDAFKTDDGRIKPVMIKGTDGGPDENPRFEKNINMGCKTFKELNLDLYIEVTNAPGLSAFNKVERKMFHLSKELTGVLLPHDKYGSHLDNAGKTIDLELEIRNFEAAGTTLGKIWGDLVIDGYETVAEFVKDPPPAEISTFVSTAIFRSNHLLETQYMSVYMKCSDPDCCEPFITNVEALFPHRRIPPLIPIKKSEAGIVALAQSKDYEQSLEFLPLGLRIVFGDSLIPGDVKNFLNQVPYDYYFPSIQDKVTKRCCNKCGKYHATIKSLAIHKKVCKGKKPNAATVESSVAEVEDIDEVGDWLDDVVLTDDDDVDDDNDEIQDLVSLRPKFSITYPDTFVERILNLKEWIKSPWAEADVNENDEFLEI